MRLLIAILFIIFFTIGIGYGMCVLFCGVSMWALCELGIIATWTWKQAALWAILLYIIWAILKGLITGEGIVEIDMK